MDKHTARKSEQTVPNPVNAENIIPIAYIFGKVQKENVFFAHISQNSLGSTAALSTSDA